MPRTTDPVRRLPSGAWQVRFRDPSGRQRKETYPSARAARARLAEVREQVRHGAYLERSAGEESFAEFAERWASSRDWKPLTAVAWQGVRYRVLPLIGDRPLAGLDRLELEALQAELGRHYSRQTVVQTMSYVRGVLRAAVATGRLARNPVIGLAPPKIRAGDRVAVRPEDVPTRAELMAIWQAAPAPYRAAIALGASGLRAGEVIAVHTDQLDFPCRTLCVDRQLQRLDGKLVEVSPKNEKVRTIRLAAAVSFELRRHRYEYQGAGRLFRTPRGLELERRDLYRLAWYPALEGAGLDPRRFKFHSLRHAAATVLLSEGVSIATVAGYLGDQIGTVQSVYAHWARDDQEVPAEVLERLLAPVATEEDDEEIR